MTNFPTDYVDEEGKQESSLLYFCHNKLQNACATIIRDKLHVKKSKVIDYTIIWNIEDVPDLMLSRFDRLVGFVGKPKLTVRAIKFAMVPKGTTIWYEPAEDNITGPGDYSILKMPPKPENPLTPEQLYDKFKPCKESATGKLRSEDEASRGNSVQAINKAASYIEGTIRRNFATKADVAQEFAQELAERLGKEGRLTDDFLDSAGFYSLVLMEFQKA